MRISELGRQTGIPVATIKYYLRERLLPSGTSATANRADYGDDHVHRLRLIRTLREVGGLGITRIRRVLEAIDDEGLPRHDLYGVVARALEPPHGEVSRRPNTEALGEVDDLLRTRGWSIRPDAATRRELADAIVALRGLGREVGAEVFEPYAEIADRMAAWEVRTIPSTASPGPAIEQMVVGTVVFERVLIALRRMAHEHHSAMDSEAGIDAHDPDRSRS